MPEREQTGELQAHQRSSLFRGFEAQPQAGQAGDGEQQPADKCSEGAVAGDQRPGGAGVVDEQSADREQGRPADPERE
ncbi:MAG TPA: hypothetical protein VMU66_06865, partial [Gaiellales bacterium]|nr:hypothetical protein [Gaiellales bacterium]